MTAINYVGTPNRSEFTYDGFGRRIAIIEKTNGTATSTKRFVFAGLFPAEERDASNSVTKCFFDEGEQIAGASYLFTRDHLGSVREMTDQAGAVRARYDYTPYGVATKLSGDMDADFGFTGHYSHPLSALNLSLYRSYSAKSGRWLSRDPVGEGEANNLYGYVFNRPISMLDIFGLNAFDIETALVNIGLSPAKASQLAMDFDDAGKGDTFVPALQKAMCEARNYSDTTGIGGPREASFTVDKNGNISNLTKATNFWGVSSGFADNRPEPTGGASLGFHSHFSGNPGYSPNGPNTMGAMDARIARLFKRPEIAIGKNDVTAFDPDTGKAVTKPWKCAK